jgi:hypothetical protein
VTGKALFFRVFKGVAGMTFFTGGKGVLSYEREGCDVVVKKHLFGPALLVMAFFTLFLLLPLMDIVLFVAVKTEAARFLFFHRGRMALIALHLCVLVFEDEFSLAVVMLIFFPLTRGMTFVTFVAKNALMIIIETMAVVTGLAWF